MLQHLGIEIAPKTATVVLGAALGLLFGILAQRSAFCLRRGLVGPESERSSALGTWAMALAVAVAGTGALLATGLLDLGTHRFTTSRLPLLAILFGGLLFGVGIYLARGCASRLTVLAGSGNLRALTVLIVFAAVAQATIKGALAPVRTALGAVTVDIGGWTSLAALPGGVWVWSTILATALALVALRSGATWRLLAAGSAIGLLAVAGWFGTGYVLKDEFDPVPAESLALTSAGAETLFWWVASSAIAPTFGVGFLAGVVLGSFFAALSAREFQVIGFTEATPTGRYLAGGGIIGAGLAGVATLSVAAILALVSIAVGAIVAEAAERRHRRSGLGRAAMDPVDPAAATIL